MMIYLFVFFGTFFIVWFVDSIILGSVNSLYPKLLFAKKLECYFEEVTGDTYILRFIFEDGQKAEYAFYSYSYNYLRLQLVWKQIVHCEEERLNINFYFFNAFRAYRAIRRMEDE